LVVYPARDIEYVSAPALGRPVKPGKADETYEHGLLRVELPFKDPMGDAAKVAIKAGVAGWEFGEGQCEVCRVERDVG
jgi:hypothetical protein